MLVLKFVVQCIEFNLTLDAWMKLAGSYLFRVRFNHRACDKRTEERKWELEQKRVGKLKETKNMEVKWESLIICIE